MTEKVSRLENIKIEPVQANLQEKHLQEWVLKIALLAAAGSTVALAALIHISTRGI